MVIEGNTMSTTVENNGSSSEYFGSEDLTQWYDTLVRYAACAQAGDPYFHGPHVAAVKADLDRVRRGLAWLYDNYAEELASCPLPTLAELLAALDNPSQGGPVSIADAGSPLHNFWHWVNG
jgi:hypothetical protein